MKKVEVAIRYDNTTFDLVGEVADLKVYKDTGYGDNCIITDKDGNVLIEISSGESQGYSYLTAVINEE